MALFPISPAMLKQLVEVIGFELHIETSQHWKLRRGLAPACVIIIPRTVKFITLPHLIDLLDKANIEDDEYFDLLCSVALVSVTSPRF
jgi:hypothetical protein